MINAKNIKSAEIAFNGVKGEIKKKIDVIKNDLIEQLSEIEARVDFEEDFSEFNYHNFSRNIKTIKEKIEILLENTKRGEYICLLYTSPSPRDRTRSRMPSSA